MEEPGSTRLLHLVGVALASGRQRPGHVPGSGWSILGGSPGGTRGKVTKRTYGSVPMLTTSSTSPGRSMNMCPGPYVVVWHWLPIDRLTVAEPCLTTMIAPPGCECQPEEPPGTTVICAIATSVPTWSASVPSDTSV